MATTAVVPGIFPTSIISTKFGGFAKDVKLRATNNYQFATAGGKRLAIWALDPIKGELRHDMVNSTPLVREYVCIAFSLNNEAYLFAGTTSGDFCAF